MMSERIKKLKEDYQNRLSKFNEDLDLPRKTNDPRLLLLPLMDEQHENYQTNELGYDPGEFTPLGYVRSHMNNLYGRLIKNANSILHFERESFPALPHSIESRVVTIDPKNITTTHHTFGKQSATLGATFTKAYPALQRIADTLTTTDRDGNVSCLGISSGLDRVGEIDSVVKHKPIYTNTEWLMPGDNIKRIRELFDSNSRTLKRLPDLIKQCHTDKCIPDPDDYKPCRDPEHTNELCTKCKVCKEHGKILAESLIGITRKSGVFGDPDSIGADNDRVLHFKNLISTCNSLANHLSDHGGNADTCASYDWIGDGMDHIRAADFLRQVSQVLTSSASIDNRDSIADVLPPGGFQHRDNIPEVSRVFPSFFGVSHEEQKNGDEY